MKALLAGLRRLRRLLMLTGTTTFLIGVISTYEQIGIAAPILLAVLRFVQGFRVGGRHSFQPLPVLVTA